MLPAWLLNSLVCVKKNKKMIFFSLCLLWNTKYFIELDAKLFCFFGERVDQG